MPPAVVGPVGAPVGMQVGTTRTLAAQFWTTDPLYTIAANHEARRASPFSLY